jgi:hypothetical protein
MHKALSMACAGLPAVGYSVQDVEAKRLGGGSFRQLQPAIKWATPSGLDQIPKIRRSTPCASTESGAWPRLLAGVRQVN